MIPQAKAFPRVLKVCDFNLEATLESGQVFGFVKDQDHFYQGVISGRRVRLRQSTDRLEILEQTERVTEQEIQHYFHLDFDLKVIYQILEEEQWKGSRPIVSPVRQLSGLRLIRQDPWEALLCFIISANNNIKRITGIRRNLCRFFNQDEFQLPAADQVSHSNEMTLRQLGLGYRAPYLFHTATYVAEHPDFFETIRRSPYVEAKEKMMRLMGVGEKVADCVLLFGFQNYEAFPVDVWIWRAMKKLYFRNRDVSERKVGEFARKRWGPFAGYVQQYVYHAAKVGIL